MILIIVSSSCGFGFHPRCAAALPASVRVSSVSFRSNQPCREQPSPLVFQQISWPDRPPVVPKPGQTLCGCQWPTAREGRCSRRRRCRQTEKRDHYQRQTGRTTSPVAFASKARASELFFGGVRRLADRDPLKIFHLSENKLPRIPYTAKCDIRSAPKSHRHGRGSDFDDPQQRPPICLGRKQGNAP